MPNVLRLVLAALVLAGCSTPSATFAPTTPAVSPDVKRLIIEVTNRSGVPTTLVVAEDLGRMGRPIGFVSPRTVAPGVTMDVAFSVPAGSWGIWVLPQGAGDGALITAQDLPVGISGRLPIKIEISRSGSYSVSGPLSEPGWFGN